MMKKGKAADPTEIVSEMFIAVMPITLEHHKLITCW